MTTHHNTLDFRLRAPEGVTFALPDSGLGQEFVEAVVQQLTRIEWHQYATLPAEVEASLPWSQNPMVRTTYTRGAEDALLQLVRHASIKQIHCARWSYPGYARIAKRLGLGIQEYASIDQLQGTRPLREDNLVVVTEPGNPFTIGATSALDPSLFGHAHLVVDAAYANPFSPEFALNSANLAAKGVPTVFTLSKTAGLAASRLGGVVALRGTSDSPEQDPRFWDAFSVSVLAVLASKHGRNLLSAFERERSELADQLVRELVRWDLPVVRSQSNLFVTCFSKAVHSASFEHLVDLVQGKRYFDKVGGSLLRIDVSRDNVKALKV